MEVNEVFEKVKGLFEEELGIESEKITMEAKLEEDLEIDSLGIVEVDADTKAKSARTAMLFSRTNTLLSLPMLLSMVAAQNLY